MTRILVVEDEQAIADTILYALKSEGFDSVHASTLQAARQQIAQSGPQLILLDVGLPDGNGFEFCKEIRARYQAPILFLTARNDEVDRIIGSIR